MGVHLARRVTGGGTVVQDSGCLNLTFLLPRSRYQAAEVYEVFRRITLPFGVQLERRDTSLYAGAFKVSGHAFAYRRERVLHHGTLLVNTDLARLTPLLVSPFQVVETHAVASNPAPVRNLHEGTIPGLLDELPSALTQVWPDSELSPLGFPHNDPALDTMAARFRSAAWIWQRTPSFSLLMPGGAFRDRSLTITAGRIAAFGNHVPEILQSAWRGLPFEKNVLLEALPLQADPGYLASIRDWVSSW